MTDTQILLAIRNKFVGTADEHEALQRLTSSYWEAYERGSAQVREEVSQRSEYEQRLIALAEAYRQGCPIDATLPEFVSANAIDRSYIADDIVRRMKMLGVTPALLSEVAEKLEASTEELSTN